MTRKRPAEILQQLQRFDMMNLFGDAKFRRSDALGPCRFQTVGLCVLFQIVIANAACAQEFWQFRGAHQGHMQSQRLPITWGGFLQEPAWQCSLPGKGWSSPIVVGKRIWLTSAEQEALDDVSAQNKLKERPYEPADYVAHRAVQLFACEIDAETGKLLRRVVLFNHESPEPIHAMNSYATPTPVSDGKIIVFHFGSLGTAAIDANSGRVLWTQQFFVDEVTGAATSPVMWQENLFLACDGADEQFLVALDKHTGKVRWRANRPDVEVTDAFKRRAFSTPILIESAGKTQLISMSAQWLLAYDPSDGTELWRAHVGSGYSAVPTPIYKYDRVYICTGYLTPELVAVSTTGSGDVTDSAIQWRYSKQVPEISSPILVGDELYFVSQRGVLTCLDTSTGKMLWHERLGGNYTASPSYFGGHLAFTSTQGITSVIRPGKTFELVAKNELFGETYASMASTQDLLLIRNGGTLTALKNSEDSIRTPLERDR